MFGIRLSSLGARTIDKRIIFSLHLRMRDESGIEWTDSTWNSTTGCTRLTAGCDNCYAHTLAHVRLRKGADVDEQSGSMALLPIECHIKVLEPGTVEFADDCVIIRYRAGIIRVLGAAGG